MPYLAIEGFFVSEDLWLNFKAYNVLS